MKRFWTGFLCGALIFAGVLFAGRSAINNWLNPNPKVDPAFVSLKLEDAAQLTTQKLYYTGLVTVEEGKIPFITKKGFSMTYTAIVTAGIDDLSKAQISVDDEAKTVSVSLPSASILDVNIDESTIAFYDEKRALFNWTEKTDVTNAIQMAKDDVATHTDLMNKLKADAEAHAIEIVKSLLEGAVGDYAVTVSAQN
ncbi:MAG: DUF4230 domain-containing protein [Galactobacillus timonensis]|uniref:DUF4230 domain-containing protein n=1 Tax=Galactobacillus timonensis TaxID=2041840 RepID=UPI0024090B56|nr:DUF4230 domain-containing protein [Galactobacillus timonensis]MDD6599014.1 DUF4230 domain-containing protein [Galactobacillus timonensis]